MPQWVTTVPSEFWKVFAMLVSAQLVLLVILLMDLANVRGRQEGAKKTSLRASSDRASIEQQLQSTETARPEQLAHV